MYYNTKRIRVFTYDLQKPGVLDGYLTLGYSHIRRIEPRVPSKFPTVGCTVELCYSQYGNSYPIDSVKGQRLIHKISYY
jgi:hypothetical protein